MRDCDHVGHRVYAERSFSNGSVHYCVQCTRCLQVVKLPEHGNRPFIRRDEIPADKAIHRFIDQGDVL